MAASSSSSCKSATSKHVKKGSANPGRQSEEAELCACDTFCQKLQQDSVPEFGRRAQPGHGGAVIGEIDVRSFVSASKIHKADREKLRRDRLNEQLLELAGALEPDRPKNDKSTILGDTIQALRDLMTEVERLQAEHASLADESQDLSQEKKELQEEKSQLRSEVERLRCGVQQPMHAAPLWMNAGDAVFMMGGGSFPYALTPFGATDLDAHLRPPLPPGQLQLPFVGPSQPDAHAQMPAATAGSMAVHPDLQAYFGYGAGGTPYLPYTVNFSNNGTPAEVSSDLPHRLGFPYRPPLIPEAQYAYGVGRTAVTPTRQAKHGGEVLSSSKPSNDECYAGNLHVQTALQLQTPASRPDP